MNYRVLVAVSAFVFVQTGPAIAVMAPFASYTLNGDYVAAGVGLRGLTSGNITIAGIPAASSVVKAYLYWGYLENAPNAAGANMNFNATPITGIQIGTGPDTCWSRTASYAYRADVTALVPGNGVYALSGVVTGGQVLVNGASLVVIYSNASMPARTIIVYDGLTVPSPLEPLPMTGFTAVAPVSARTTFVVGDGQNIGRVASFTGSLGTNNLGNVFVGGEGNWWDTVNRDVTAQVGAGSTTVTATIGAGGDCLMWLAQVFSVSATGTPVIPVIPPAKTNLGEGTHAGATGPPGKGKEGSYGHGQRGLAQLCNGCGGGGNFGPFTSHLFGPFPDGRGYSRVFNIASQLPPSVSANVSEEVADIVVPLAFTLASLSALIASLILLWKKPSVPQA